MRNVRQGGERELGPELSTELLNEGLPHKAASGIVREREVEGLVEELFELLLTARVRLTCAADDGHSRFIV